MSIKTIKNITSREKIFNSANFFMMRTPLLPIDMYINLFCEPTLFSEKLELYTFIDNNKIIKEAILVSSLSLYNEIETLYKLKDIRKREQVVRSLVKYLIRMTTRTTPFGIFSGVAQGNFNKSTEITIMDNKENIKRARPDMEWIYGVIRELENNQEILEDLHLIKNDLAIVNGTRLDIGYISNYGQLMKEDNLDNITASIRYTIQVEKVLKITESPVKYKDIMSILTMNNPDIELKKIEGFLKQLIENEYLITELRPPLGNTNQFEYILSRLKDIRLADNIFGLLEEINVLIDKYNILKIGEGIDLYIRIIEKMKTLYKCSNYLQVDMATAIEKINLNDNIATEIEEVVDFINRLSNGGVRYDYLGEYLKDFLEVYGEDREVQILKLLDEDNGIGAPAGYTKPVSHRQMRHIPISSEEKKIQSILSNKVLIAILNNKKEIILTDEDFDKTETKSYPGGTPNSLEIYVMLSSLNINNQQDYTIHLGPMYGSNTSGKTFGRFIDIMPERIKQDFIELEKSQQELYGDDTIVVEIVELPQLGRLSNVSLNWNPREYELAISTNTSSDKIKIDIKDLYIGIDNKDNKRMFYIRSKSLNKRLIIKSNNMLNITHCSNIYRFLLEVSLMNEENIFSNLYNTFSQCFIDINYTPRIRYRKSIIYPATWILSNAILNINKKNYTKDEFYKSINEWVEIWEIPKFVYLKEGDNRLLLNLHNTLHLNELFYMLSKDTENNIILTEIEGELEDRIIDSKQGRYFTEIVVPMLKNKNSIVDERKKDELQTILTKSEYSNRRSEISSLDVSRTFFPGDEWLSIKLYGNSKRMDELIGCYLFRFYKELLGEKEPNKFFFIRYADPEKHLRLRIHGTKEAIQQKVLPKLNIWLKTLANDGLLKNAIIDTYNRELERYGGIKLIELAEEIFYKDSIFVCKIIEYFRQNKLGTSMEIIVMASIINIMEELGINYEIQKKIFMNSFDKNLYRNFFRDFRKEILSICNSDYNWNGLKEIAGGDIIFNLFELRKDSLNKFANKMGDLDNEGELWNSKKTILFSLIHMHCNRMLGSNQKEQLILATIRHTLHGLEFYKNQQGTI